MSPSLRLRLAVRHVAAHPVRNLAIAAALAFTTALACALFLFAQGLQTGLIRAVEPFELVVGAKGSPYQLVLNTVFLQDVPIGNIPWSAFEALADDPRVRLAVPLAFGDSVRGFPLAGTTADIAKVRVRPSDPPWLRLREGRLFEREFEAVLGSEAAAALGLRVGDAFKSSHGLVRGGDEHDEAYTVVGIAEPLGGPYDRAVFVNLESVWESHAHHGQEEGDAHDEHGHEHKKSVTAVLVHPSSYMNAYALAVDFQNDPTEQIVFPAQTAVRLFSLIGRGERFLSAIVYAVAGCALLTTMLVLYAAGAARSRERALLGVLGVSGGELAVVAWLEAAIVVFAGNAAGWLMGRLGALALFRGLGGTTALSLSVSPSPQEALIPLALFLAGSLAGLLPAWQSRRSEWEKAV